MTPWLNRAAVRDPERLAIECGGRRITYSELRQRAGQLARAWERLGVQPGDRVGLELEDRFDFALAVHGCLLRASPAVPIDVRLSPGERALRAAGARTLVGALPEMGETEPVSITESGPEVGAVAAVMHTSGTTSAPKEIELTYGNWEASALGSAVALGLDPAERWLCPMPLTHVGGLSILIRSAIYATTAVLHEWFDTEAVLNYLMDPAKRITMVSLVPTMLVRLLDAGLERPPALRWALLGGGPIPQALVDRAARAGVPVAPTYGMTETCSQIATFGVPLPGVEVRVGTGGETEVDQPGGRREILVRGPMVAPGATDSAGWLHTGDLGRWDSEGRLEVVGRLADTIITGGENVAPAEVEAVLLAHPGVADAAAVGRHDAEWGEAVVALVVPRDSRPLDVEELRRHCRERLAAFKVPKTVELVDRLPRTASGKLLRRELR